MVPIDRLRLIMAALNQGIRSGLSTAVTTYRRGSLSPNGLGSMSPAFGESWDSYLSRLFRYYHHDLYYFNQVFTQLEAYANQHLSQDGLYKYARGIYNPVFRLVQITAAKCYGGNLDVKTLTQGAIPMNDLDEHTTAALRQLWRDSNLGSLKMRYARQTARHADGVIKVVDEPRKGRVRLEVYHPGIIREAAIDPVGYVKGYVIEYEREDPEAPGELCGYREVGTQEKFETYRVKNGQAALYPWNLNANGQPSPEWENTYGFVPLVLVQASDIGQKWGATTFHGGILSKIDQLNDLASLTVDHIRQAVDAMWYMAGVDSVAQLKQSELDADTDEADINDEERNHIPVLTGPEGSSAQAMIAQVDFSGAIQKMDRMIKEIESDCPELAFYRLLDYQQHSAPAVRTVLGPAIDRLTEFNGNLDAGLIRAFQMSLSMGGVGGYPNYEPFDLGDYDQGNLDFGIKQRDIVLDDVSLLERLNLLKDTDAPPRWIWTQLGIDEADAIQAENDKLDQERVIAGAVGKALATGIADEEAEADA